MRRYVMSRAREARERSDREKHARKEMGGGAGGCGVCIRVIVNGFTCIYMQCMCDIKDFIFLLG